MILGHNVQTRTTTKINSSLCLGIEIMNSVSGDQFLWGPDQPITHGIGKISKHCGPPGLCLFGPHSLFFQDWMNCLQQLFGYTLEWNWTPWIGNEVCVKLGLRAGYISPMTVENQKISQRHIDVLTIITFSAKQSRIVCSNQENQQNYRKNHKQTGIRKLIDCKITKT